MQKIRNDKYQINKSQINHLEDTYLKNKPTKIKYVECLSIISPTLCPSLIYNYIENVRMPFPD